MNSNLQCEPEASRPLANGQALSSADLQTLLAVWESATSRLEQTHLVLQEEVRRLTEELEVKNRELSRKNRLADLGQMAAHIAHEVRNGLVPVTVYLSMLRRRHSEDLESTRIVAKMESAFTAVDSIVSDLLQFTSQNPPRRETTLMKRFCDELFEPLAANAAAQGIRIELDIPDQAKFQIDSAMLRRALLNLSFNAIDAMPQGGRLSIRAYETPGAAHIDVADTGPGIPADALPRLFEPFFTTKSSGTGLGLAIVRRICEAHEGEITVDSSAEGARFCIRIPSIDTKEMAA
jgi:signal transduction histidine kinase